MTITLSSNARRRTSRMLCMAWLGFLILRSGLCGAIAADRQPGAGNYADLPELSGPFSELKNLPESLKNIPILRTPRGEIVILPTTVGLYPGKPGFRLEYNLLAATGNTPGPAVRLELFVQPTVSDFAAAMDAISNAFPTAKIGRPGISAGIRADLLAGDLFVEHHRETILMVSSRASISDIVLATVELKPLFMTALAGDGDIIGVRITYEILIDDKARQYSTGMTFALNCRTSPESFLDLMNFRHGCPDYEPWRLTSSELRDRLSECVSRAGLPSAAPAAALDRWRDWKRKDCAMALFAAGRHN